jgi:site-specific DNA-methyltransferase (adenine-specific)
MGESMTDIVTIGNATLYHGDCREILPSLPKVDLVLTDPPYGIGASSKKFINGTSKTQKDYYEDICWDTSTPDKQVMDLVLLAGSHQIIWGGNYFDLPPSRQFLVWDKTIHGNSYADCELAWSSQNANARIKQLNMVACNIDGRVHPTQKPIALIEWCLDLAPKNTLTVADPFMGSGTTGVACANMGKTFYGIERERKYFDIACERIERAYAQQRLFE